MKHRKLMSLGLALALLFALASCGSNDNGQTPSPSETPSQSDTPSPSDSPSESPSDSPSEIPSESPSETPSEVPSASAGQSDGADLQKFYESLTTKYEADEFSANMPVEGDFLTNYYGGLSDISLKQRVIYQPMISAVVCEIALAEVENADDVQKVKDVFQARIDAQVGTDDNPGLAYYPMSIEGWTNNSRIVSNGNFVMLIVWDKCDQIVADFNALF